MKTLTSLILGCLLLVACATSKPGTVSTIPWDDRQQIDGLGQQYGWGEGDYIYDGMITPEQPL